MIAIVDYGVGNLFSLKSSFGAIGAEAVVTADKEVLEQADHIVLPGVGAFGDAAQKLRESGMARSVLEQAQKGKPLLGICLGMQLLFEKSYEYGEHEGLGLLQGRVVPMAGRIPEELKIPHMGWNRLTVTGGKLLRDVNGEYVYFVHSYFADGCEASLAAVAEYGIPLPCQVSGGGKTARCGASYAPIDPSECGSL